MLGDDARVDGLLLICVGIAFGFVVPLQPLKWITGFFILWAIYSMITQDRVEGTEEWFGALVLTMRTVCILAPMWIVHYFNS